MSKYDEYLACRKVENVAQMRRAIAFVHSAEPATLAYTLAARRVRRGAWLLRRIAPSPGWWRNCLNGAYSRVHVQYSEESPAALAFEYEAKFADEFGYVQDWKVLKHFFGTSNWQFRAQSYGLCGGLFGSYTPFERRHPAVIIENKILDEAWRNFLLNPPGDWTISYRQPDATARWLLRTGLIKSHKQRWWQRLFRRYQAQPA